MCVCPSRVPGSRRENLWNLVFVQRVFCNRDVGSSTKVYCHWRGSPYIGFKHVRNFYPETGEDESIWTNTLLEN